MPVDRQRPNGPTIRRHVPSFGVELSARWALNVSLFSLPGPMALAIGTAGPLGRNKKTVSKTRSSFWTGSYDRCINNCRLLDVGHDGIVF